MASKIRRGALSRGHKIRSKRIASDSFEQEHKRRRRGKMIKLESGMTGCENNSVPRESEDVQSPRQSAAPISPLKIEFSRGRFVAQSDAGRIEESGCKV